MTANRAAKLISLTQIYPNRLIPPQDDERLVGYHKAFRRCLDFKGYISSYFVSFCQSAALQVRTGGHKSRGVLEAVRIFGMVQV